MSSGIGLLFQLLRNKASYPCPATSIYSYKLSLLKHTSFCDRSVGILKLQGTKELRMAAKQRTKQNLTSVLAANKLRKIVNSWES